MKVCSNCNLLKDFDSFNKGSRYKDGYRARCKECFKIYRESIRDVHIEYSKNYKKANKDVLKIKNKNWRIRKADEIKKWREENKEYIKQRRIENKVNMRNYLKTRRDNEPVFRFKQNVRRLILHSFKRGGKNLKKIDKTEVILGCKIEEFIIYISLKFVEGMTLDNHGKWHIDHIIPLASANTEEDVIRLNHYTNLQPLWSKDNLSKGAKILHP